MDNSSLRGMFLTPVNPRTSEQGALGLQYILWSDIAWAQPYRSGTFCGVLILHQNGTFRCYRQSYTHLSRQALRVVGDQVRAGLPPMEAPWISV